MKLALMQGRLLPPIDRSIQKFPIEGWEHEFQLASRLELDAIEWIVDDVPNNPMLGPDEHIERIRSISLDNRVFVRSICADIFMQDLKLAQGTISSINEAVRTLLTLIKRAGELNIDRIVLPFVDSSELKNPEDFSRAAESIESALELADETATELHLETSLGPDAFADFLNRLPSSLVKVNFDMGNSAANGFNPEEEFAAYGERIGSVHIKDRLLGGPTVALGTGSTDFSSVFNGLNKLAYSGDYVLQVARGKTGDEVNNIQRTMDFVGQFLA